MRPPPFAYTQKGWCGFCPVYIADFPEEDSMSIIPRWDCLQWLLDVSTAFQIGAMRLTGNYVWPCFVTGTLKKPIVR